MKNSNTSRIVQRSPDDKGRYITDYHFNAHRDSGTLTVTMSHSGFISSHSDLKVNLADDDTTFAAAIDAIEAFVIGLVENGKVGYSNNQITPEIVAKIMYDTQVAANNL